MTRLAPDFDVEAHQRKVAAWRSPPTAQPALAAETAPEASAPTARKPRGDYVPMRKRQMNKLETAYAQLLEAKRACGEISWWKFEPMRLRLADDTYYRPDFAVVGPDGLSFHETKGFMREAARVRLHVAAEHFPFPFFLVRKKPHGFEVRRIGQS